MSKKIQAIAVQTTGIVSMDRGIGSDKITSIIFTTEMVMNGRPNKRDISKLEKKIHELLKIVEVK